MGEESVSQEFAQISVVDYGAFILVAIGVAIVIQSIMGCTGTMMGCSGNSRARTFLISYGVLVALVVICEIVAAILVLHVYKGKISAEAKSFMKKTIKEDYRVEGTENSVTLLWNQIMTSLECCGVDDFNDFTGGAPGSCCNSSHTKSPDDDWLLRPPDLWQCHRHRQQPGRGDSLPDCRRHPRLLSGQEGGGQARVVRNAKRELKTKILKCELYKIQNLVSLNLNY